MISDRSRALHVRGNVALAATVAAGLFLVPALAGAGRWTSLHTYLTVGVVGVGLLALLCYALAALAERQDSPRGESPQVSHPDITPSLTPSEVRK